MTRYLLDTNTLSDSINNFRGPVARRIRQVGIGSVCTSIIVAAEIRFGAAKNPRRDLLQRIEEALHGIEIMPFEHPADQFYGDIRARLEHLGKPIGGNDMLIAAHALALDCTLVTANSGEFARVEGLVHESWL